MPRVLTKEQKLAESRRRKLRELGRPAMIQDPEVIAELVGYVRYLVDEAGMPMRRLAALAGVAQSSISEFHEGIRRSHAGARKGKKPLVRVLRRTRNAIMAVRPEVQGPNHGARTPAFGTVRRLQALNADGFSHSALAELLGWPKSMVGRLIGGRTLSDGPHQFLFWATRVSVAEMYAKYQDTDPLDLGHPAWVVERTSREARAKGYAPRLCWDEDTIDVQREFPEWTGACGSYKGYNIHRRENIVVCPPCAGAAAEYNREGRIHTGGRPRKHPRKEDQQ